MSPINRFSSRRQRLDHAFLSAKLKGAQSYKRIAGYFRSSIFELVGEEIAAIPQVQIVCNSELDAADVAVSKHARETALKGTLHQLRNSIGLFQAHNGCYPIQLSDLMLGRSAPPAQGVSQDGSTMVDIVSADWQGPYLETPDTNLPNDPITGAADWNYEASGANVGAIHSAATGVGIAGGDYSSW